MNDTTDTNDTNDSSDSNANTTVLVTGGTGKTGRRVVERLKARNVPSRVGSRSGTPPFDWDDATTWGPALDGVGAVYVAYYPDLAFPGAAEKLASFAERAVAGGVERLALLSGRGEAGAFASEQAVRAAAPNLTVLRSTWFAQNFSESFLLDPVLEGVIALPAADVAEPFVDIDDLADVAVAALTEDGHAGEVYELTGPRLLTFADVAAEISEYTNRTIQYIPVTTEDYVAMAMDHGVPAEVIGPLADLFAEVLDGRNSHLTDGVQRALGRSPRDFSDYAKAAAASGVWDA